MNEDEKDFLADLGIDTTDSETDPEVDPETDPETDPGIDPETDTETDPDDPNTDSEDSTDEAQREYLKSLIGGQEKDAKAFARMRVENKSYKNVVNKLAETLGLDPKLVDQDSLLEQVQAVMTASQAKQQNIPVELLDRLNKLEQVNTLYQQEHYKNKAQADLIAIQEKYSLPDEDMEKFIGQLDEDNINPLESDVDFETEFIKRNFDAVVNAKITAAVQKEAERSARAQQQGTEPDSTTGGVQTEKQNKIETVKDLDKLFNSLN